MLNLNIVKLGPTSNYSLEARTIPLGGISKLNKFLVILAAAGASDPLPLFPENICYQHGVLFSAEDKLRLVFDVGVFSGDTFYLVSSGLDSIQKRIIMGTYYGYPECCIKTFVLETTGIKHLRLPNREYRKYVEPKSGNCFVLCPECRSRYMTADITKLVDNRRRCSTSITEPDNDNQIDFLFWLVAYGKSAQEQLCASLTPTMEERTTHAQQVAGLIHP